ISWPKLRSFLGVNRLSMPDADRAKEITGYARGTITPLGARQGLPVIADERVRGTISIGAGGHGLGARLDAAALLAYLHAGVADVTDPAAGQGADGPTDGQETRPAHAHAKHATPTMSPYSPSAPAPWTTSTPAPACAGPARAWWTGAKRWPRAVVVPSMRSRIGVAPCPASVTGTPNCSW